MKHIIIGLGYFGSSLSMKLTSMGHEVIAVDLSKSKVEEYKDRITHTVALDATDSHALSTLPLSDSDFVIVGIGEDFGASVQATANLKQLNPKKLISRAISPIHQTVLEAIGVDEIVRPEQETAERLARRLDIKGIRNSFELSEDYHIIEAIAPSRYINKAIKDADFRQEYHINILTIKRPVNKQNMFGMAQKKPEVIGTIKPDTVIMKEDILVMFGQIKDIERLLN